MATRGRKTLLTPETVKELVNVIAAGGTDKDAYTYVGISAETFYSWMKKSEFSEQIIRARAQSKVRRIARIAKAGETDWRADAWYLERRYPEEYAQHLIVKLTPEQAAALAKIGVSAGDVLEQFIQAYAEVDHAER